MSATPALKLEDMNLAKVQAEIANLMANTGKLNAEQTKMLEETAKLRRERRWYPAVVGIGTFATLLGASAAAIKLFS